MSRRYIFFHLSALLTVTLVVTCQSIRAQNATSIYERTAPAVVIIISSDANHRVFQGSGVILRADGIIATNYHVIEDATQAQIKLKTGEIYDDVTILETDERKDIAILKIKAINLPIIPIADSDILKVGDAIYVIGSPEGLEGSLSSGLISGLRLGEDVDSSISGFRVIQFTAPVSHGSSGGALLNDSGKLVGLVFKGFRNGQNLNLAIPANYVAPLAATTQTEGRKLARLTRAPKATNAPSVRGNIEDIAGTYTGRWVSDEYAVSGVLVLTVVVANNQVQTAVSLTGSDMFKQDTLITNLTPMGAGVWKMDYKSKNGKIKGTGLFRGGGFEGDYRFSKFIWHDRGQWIASK